MTITKIKAPAARFAASRGQSALEYIVILGTLSALTLLLFGPLQASTALGGILAALEGTFQSAVGAIQAD